MRELRPCPGRVSCKRLLGSGAGFIFKGTGFYETDFKDKKGTPPEKSKGGGASETKAEPKTEKKAESKSPGEKAKTGGPKKKAANG
jgi:predicted nucleic acid-binding Zn ribbon protein